jgi:hypothetical protein
VPDPKSRIAGYQREADACMAKAKHAPNKTVRNQYVRLADTYLKMIELERRRIEIRATLKNSET